MNCQECRAQISDDAAALCPQCGIPLAEAEASLIFKATDKDRFEVGIRMMKEYYDALEARLAGSLTFYVVIIGWLVTSEGARAALATRWLLWGLCLATLTVVLGLYIWNILHWLARWRYIRKNTISLNYMQRRFFTRYERLPPRTWAFYITPIALLYVFIFALLIGIKAGWFPSKNFPMI